MSSGDYTALARQIQLDLEEIRVLARRINTPEAFAALLAHIPELQLREHVKTLLRPLVGFSPHAE